MYRKWQKLARLKNDQGDLADEKKCELKDRIAYEAAATGCKRKTSQTVNDR